MFVSRMHFVPRVAFPLGDAFVSLDSGKHSTDFVSVEQKGYLMCVCQRFWQFWLLSENWDEGLDDILPEIHIKLSDNRIVKIK